MSWVRGRAFVFGLALLLATNAFALGQIILNRAAPPESSLLLTGRELAPAYQPLNGNEDSAVFLYVSAKVDPRGRPDPKAVQDRWLGPDIPWLDADHLIALGARPLSEHGRGTPEILDVLFVLELDGPAYQRALARDRQLDALALQAGHKSSGCEGIWGSAETGSHLFLVDVGLDALALRERYPDRQRYAVVHGQLMVEGASEANRRDTSSSRQRALQASMKDLTVAEVLVPSRWRSAVAQATRLSSNPCTDPNRQDRAQGLTARVNFGRRLEPWIAEMTVRPLP